MVETRLEGERGLDIKGLCDCPWVLFAWNFLVGEMYSKKEKGIGHKFYSLF